MAETPIPHRQSLALGVLANWQLYDGTTAHRYLHALLRGVYSGAAERGHHVLMSCGVGAAARPYIHVPAWPVPTPNSYFTPVGPWNCDGLVVIPPVTDPARGIYVQELRASGYPVVFAGAGEAGPTVRIDNASGIAQVVAHLAALGHRRIAFLAGYPASNDDSGERLLAFEAAMRQHGLPFDSRLVAFGRHNHEDGLVATHELLGRGLPFTALVASNDESAFGALDALGQAGLRIPEDVAVTGFDDILDARIQLPPLTTVHFAPFELGYRAILALDDLIHGAWDGNTPIQIPTRLVVRRSCGATPAGTHAAALAPCHPSAVAQHMADAALTETQRCPPELIHSMCSELVETFTRALARNEPQQFAECLTHILRRTEALSEESAIWHEALTVLRQHGAALASGQTPEQEQRAGEMIDQARVSISERMRRQTTRALVHQMDVADRVGAMTAQLLAVFEEAHIAATLAAHLANVGIAHLVVATYEADDDDPVAWSNVVISCGVAGEARPARFRSRTFPPPGLYPPGALVRLAVLPLIVEDAVVGFAAFDAANLEPCAAIMRNLASALRTSRLYREASEGRKLAEEANRLKSRFLSMVSHELRTPLNLIAGLSDMLLRADEATPAPEQRADLERIVTSAQHLDRLIGDVLDLASSDIGQLRLSRAPLDLGAALQMVAVTGERMARERGLAWRAHLPESGPHVFGDRTRLRQIVLNLISNAVKFTSQGEIALTVGTQAGAATIRVSDTGLGIAPEDQPHIFEEFRRGERTAALGYRGLGLGLAICKQLVELHAGTIHVESSGVAGAGSTFTVTLPLLEAQTQGRLALPQFEAGHAVVILAEDMAAAISLKEQLHQRGVTAHIHAGGCSDADMHVLLSPPPAALLLDRGWATRYGWQLEGVLKQHAATANMPLLLFEINQHGDAGALLEWQHASKPLDPARLVALLAETGGAAQAGRKTVLIVDDNAGMRDLHARMVQAHMPQYAARTASNGHEALAAIRVQRPDMVLLDLLMPELDGFGVIEALRADPDFQSIPVVVLTAQRLSDDDLARLGQGVSAVLTKGVFSADETVGHIAAAIERHRKLGGVTQRLVHRALGYIHAHYAEPLGRELIARHVGVNENYLTDCFHREMGITPMNYLNRYRVQQAQRLLHTTEQPITAIALAVGFSESAYFSRVFQRVVGVSPSAYRRQHALQPHS